MVAWQSAVSPDQLDDRVTTASSAPTIKRADRAGHLLRCRWPRLLFINLLLRVLVLLLLIVVLACASQGVCSRCVSDDRQHRSSKRDGSERYV